LKNGLEEEGVEVEGRFQGRIPADLEEEEDEEVSGRG